jgi:hypothetical protein
VWSEVRAYILRNKWVKVAINVTNHCGRSACATPLNVPRDQTRQSCVRLAVWFRGFCIWLCIGVAAICAWKLVIESKRTSLRVCFSSWWESPRSGELQHAGSERPQGSVCGPEKSIFVSRTTRSWQMSRSQRLPAPSRISILNRYSDWLRDRSSSPATRKDFFSLLSVSSRPVLGPTHLTIQWLPGDFFSGDKAAGTLSWSTH